MDAAQRIYQVVSQIPRGKVMSYSDVAKAVGIKSARFVGTALHKNTDPEHVPCHRVVRQDGKLADQYAFGGRNIQEARLRHEGVVFVLGRVNLKVSRLKM